MRLAQAFQFSLLQRRQALACYSPRFCRRMMRGWAKFWREKRRDKEQFDVAELALGNALAWRDRATWPDVLREGGYTQLTKDNHDHN